MHRLFRAAQFLKIPKVQRDAMLAQIRTFAKTPFAGALMALLVASFAVLEIFGGLPMKGSTSEARGRPIERLQ